MGTKLFAIAAVLLAVIMLPACGNGTEIQSAEEQPRQEEQPEITYAEAYMMILRTLLCRSMRR